jgi:hypothetical protein
MKYTFSFAVLFAAACAHKSAPGPAAPVVLTAVTDFSGTELAGFAPYYKDDNRKALAIDASKYKDQFAAASTTFNGTAGVYDVTIITLAETDGESTYRLKVDGTEVGTFQNPPSRPNYDQVTHTWKGVRLAPGTKLQVESNTHSNGKVPEGDAFGYARGRWTNLKVEPGSAAL